MWASPNVVVVSNTTALLHKCSMCPTDNQAPAMPCPLQMHMLIKQHADCTSVPCNLARVSRHIFSLVRNDEPLLA
jgi:hypothetical protein